MERRVLLEGFAKIKGFLRLYRPDVPVIVFMGTFIGRILTTGYSLHIVFESAFVAMFLYNFVYTLNSITDRIEDSVNKPWRPMTDGTLTKHEAVIWLMFITTASAIGIPLLFKGIEIFLAFLIIFLGISYSLPPLILKKRLFIAPLITGWGVVHPLYITGGMKLFWVTSSLLLHAVGITFLKDLSDVKGDKLAGRSVITEYFGLNKIVMISIILKLMSIAAFQFTNYPEISIIPAVSIFVLIYLYIEKGNDFTKTVYKKLIWTTALTSFFVILYLSLR